MAQRVGRGIALLFHDRGTRRGWVVNLLLLVYKTHAEMPVYRFLTMLQSYGYYGGVLEKQQQCNNETPVYQWIFKCVSGFGTSVRTSTATTIKGSGPEGSRKLRFPDFMTTAQDGGKIVSLMHRPPLPPRKCSWYSFPLEAESTPVPKSMKNSNDTGWDRTSDLPIVAQHLNHCASTPQQLYITLTSVVSAQIALNLITWHHYFILPKSFVTSSL